MKKRFFSIFTVLVVFCSLMETMHVSAATSKDMTISQNGIEFICSVEGFSKYCYFDGAQSSIGYGTKCGSKAHKSGMHSITKENAKKEMTKVIENRYIPNVRKQTSNINMNQNQFDSLVSFTYNTGGGTTMIKNSPLVKYLQGKLTVSDARSQYSKYIVTDSATGKVSQGLINRRNKEADLFFKNISPTPPSTNTTVTNLSTYTISSSSGSNVRSGAGTSYAVKGALAKTSSSTPAQAISKYTIKSSSGAKVREKAGTSYATKGALAKGSVVYYDKTASANGYTWLHIVKVEAKSGSWGNYTNYWVAKV